MNNMKSYIFILCTIIVTAGFACNKAMEPSGETNRLEKIKNQYDEIGEQHNESLDYVYNSLDELKHKEKSRSDIMQFALERSRQHLESRYNVPEVKQIAGTLHDAETDRLSISAGKNKEGHNASYFMRTLERNGLQGKEKTYILEIGEAVESSDNTDHVTDKIEGILEEAEAHLEDDELRTVVLAADVGLASAAYWDKNIEAWQQKMNALNEGASKVQDDKDASVQFIQWKGVAKADIAGAVGGVVGSAVTGCAAMTAGACAGVGALSGGLGGSAASATRTIVDYYWEADPVTYPELKN